MRIVFSKDRPAQIDLLLTSLERHAWGERTVVLYRGRFDHLLAYDYVKGEHPAVEFQLEQDFDADLRALLRQPSETVTFLCDDDVLYRPVGDPAAILDDDRILCVSWRLGYTNPDCPMDLYLWQDDDLLTWTWEGLPEHDFGYPGSIDGHTFRTADVRRMLGEHTIDNPTMLETILQRRCETLAHDRPLMACYRDQALVGVPVNRVADIGGVKHGEKHPQPVQDLTRAYLAGRRIDLDALEPMLARADECHLEVAYPWRNT